MKHREARKRLAVETAQWVSKLKAEKQFKKAQTVEELENIKKEIREKKA